MPKFERVRVVWLTNDWVEELGAMGLTVGGVDVC